MRKKRVNCFLVAFVFMSDKQSSLMLTQKVLNQKTIQLPNIFSNFWNSFKKPVNKKVAIGGVGGRWAQLLY